MADTLTGLAGGAIVFVVAADIFRSLLVPRASTRALRVGPALTIALFAAWQRAANLVAEPRVRQTIRACLAPFMLVANMAIWSALLIVGFGMIFWADRSSFDPTFRTLSDAIYAAGSAFSTLGVAGTVSSDPTRIAVLVCSVAGLAIVTVVATFLISIQNGFGRRETLVLRLESHVTLPPAGIAILETYAREEITERLAAFFDTWELWAAELAISHRAYPILLFFRSNDPRCEWLAAFGAVMDAAALLDATVVAAPPSAKAGAHFVLRTGARMLSDMAAQFTSGTAPDVPLADDERFRAHRRRLAECGYALVEDADAAQRRFEERRATYAASLAALGHRLRIDVDERTGGGVESEPQGSPGRAGWLEPQRGAQLRRRIGLDRARCNVAAAATLLCPEANSSAIREGSERSDAPDP